ncbi:type I phosphomannose isomerase catalytic subunit [Yeosuana aromativorans]|nr:type I phosphomannose isomerase catalytic subunit [Yeosuana aromativorans]
MKLDHPITFHPILKERIWGGDKLTTIFKKESDKSNIGESWELSDVEGDVSVVASGELKGKNLKELITEYKGALVGEKVYNMFGNDFPILIKYIDAKTPLSIQVHPSNELAKERHNSFGKNEMWYIMQADHDAELIVGFNQDIDKETYLHKLEEGNVLDILNAEKISKGDTFYIPTGRVHAIGAGVMLAEIQQTSDITYRIYDYNRVDAKTGKERELHTDLAVDAIDYKQYDSYKTAYELKKNESSELVHSPYFKTNIIQLEGIIQKDYSNLDSFVIYMCVEGTVVLNCNNQAFSLQVGQTMLLPAAIDTVELNSESAKILEVFL